MSRTEQAVVVFSNSISSLLVVQVSAEINTASIPTLDGAMLCLAAGVMSSMHSQNAKASAAVTNAQQAIQHETWPLMVDPQTGTVTTIPWHSADFKFMVPRYKATLDQVERPDEMPAESWTACMSRSSTWRLACAEWSQYIPAKQLENAHVYRQALA